MIDYSPFFDTLKQKNESTYTMIHKYNISSSLINRLRNNKPISTTTLNDLCRILNCNVEEILIYIPNEEDQKL
ncbi:MAG: helix-turn-helix transcriptional regulator [Lachnospiraceae bacterium]|nr:helix-turn-helix transcriptional regulator [Lachnospiraceae bacterium]